ncbi:MAG: NAD(P)-dependent alcohol dehydrogenase [Candidatus Nanopelagicaceae bacterium]|nr:NAD(P)-dependent alcohol dehydrogenase [Candidatus Nanopelagicaceae bacterium]
MKSRGMAVKSSKTLLEPYEFERRELRPNDVALDISYAGICHSDIHQAREEWGPSLYPMVPGHEIVGFVTAIGGEVKKFSVGQRIGVGVFIDSCRTCKNCLRGLEQYCENGMTGTYNSYERDGVSIAMGGYSNNFVIDADYAVHVPENLDLAGVAPLLCAGITLYSPLKHWGAQPGMKVGVIGLGGLGHMGVKFAKALGANVTVFSHSPGKENDALAMGTDHFVLTKEVSNLKQYSKQFDLILNTVSAELDINAYLNLLTLNGTLVVIGLPGKPYSVNAGALLDGRRSLAGSQIGGISETQKMLNFCGVHNIVSDVEVIPAEYVNTAYERTVASDVKYRFVIDGKTF